MKSVGWLNARARFEQARWPFTRNAEERRTRAGSRWRSTRTGAQFAPYRFDAALAGSSRASRYLKELWFAGVHSDVGGQYESDHRLSDIAFGWMADEAIAAGLKFDAKQVDR